MLEVGAGRGGLGMEPTIMPVVEPAVAAAEPAASVPRASVVVVNFNGRHFLERCLGALAAQDFAGGLEVVLVDNASSDGSAEFVAGRFRDVHVVSASRNLGFAGGNNLGIRAARGRHVVLINNDTRADPGWLAALVATAEADSGAGAVTSKLVFLERPDVIQNAGGIILADGSGADRGAGEVDLGQYDRREEVFGACGGAVLLNRAALADVGLFDERFFAYYEDTDLSWRMRLRGWRIVYEPAARVEHLHAGTSVEWSPFFTFHADRNRIFMLLKNAPARMVVAAGGRFAFLAAKGVAGPLYRRLRPRRGAPVAPAGGRQGMSGAARAAVHARVLASLLLHLPGMLLSRRRIRGRRSVSDAEIARWFRDRAAGAAR